MDVGQFLQLLFAGGAGGVLLALVQYIRARGQNQVEAKAQRDEYSLKLINALNADEDTFRKALLETIRDLRKDLAEEQKARSDLDARLTKTQSDLTIVTLERDELRRKLDKAQIDLDQAHQKIRHMEEEIAVLQRKEMAA